MEPEGSSQVPGLPADVHKGHGLQSQRAVKGRRGGEAGTARRGRREEGMRREGREREGMESRANEGEPTYVNVREQRRAHLSCPLLSFPRSAWQAVHAGESDERRGGGAKGDGKQMDEILGG